MSKVSIEEMVRAAHESKDYDPLLEMIPYARLLGMRCLRLGDVLAAPRIGITDYAQDQLGDIVYVQLPAVGSTVAAGDSVGELESTKSVSDLYSPLSGEVVAVNDALDATPELVNSDPYGDGWIFEVRVSDPATIEGLMDATAYEGQLS